MPEQQSHEADLVRELRVVVAPTAVPLLRTQRQLDGHTVIVSAGWLALLDELLRAEAVPQHEKDGKKECLSGYQSSLELALRANRDRGSMARIRRRARGLQQVEVHPAAQSRGADARRPGWRQRGALAVDATGGAAGGAAAAAATAEGRVVSHRQRRSGPLDLQRACGRTGCGRGIGAVASGIAQHRRAIRPAALVA